MSCRDLTDCLQAKHRTRHSASHKHHALVFFRRLADLGGWKNRPRNGKVARLPELLRLRINQMLDDGLRYRAIIKVLGYDTAHPLPYALSEMNISNWFNGGYQDWYRTQDR